MKWQRAGKKIDLPINEYLENLIKHEISLNHNVFVSVGTDSQRSGGRYKFATAILIQVKEKMDNGIMISRGCKIISATYYMDFFKKNKESINERMLAEVTKSIEVAYEITPLLDLYGIKLEIHADINPDPKCESNKVLTQATGYILGMGYNFKVKPTAWAASCAGNHYAK